MRRGSALRLLASPLIPVYAAGVWGKNAAYDSRLLRPRNLSQPVVGIGNLSVGGTGKTPMTMLLARLLEARGWRVDVLSRGYGRASDRVEPVDPDGITGRAVEEFG
ncbi:MAG: tetraacyldisaccharide 4'-kinase, partial [Gemmataceae bacterium]